MVRMAPLLCLVACGPAPLPATAADGCFEVGTALCNKIRQCGTLTTTEPQCRADAVVVCCGSGDCSRPVRNCKTGSACCADADCKVTAIDAKVFTDCEAGVDELTCGQLAAGLRPAGCVKQ